MRLTRDMIDMVQELRPRLSIHVDLGVVMEFVVWLGHGVATEA